MKFESEVHGRTSSHHIILTMPDDEYIIGLKINSFDTKRCFLVDPCNSIEPTIGGTKRRMWCYFVSQDTEYPEYVSRYCTEKQVIVIGLLGYRRYPHGGKIPLSWEDFLDQEPSRRAFSDRLSQFKSLSVERWMQEKKDDSDEMKRILAGKVKRIA